MNIFKFLAIPTTILVTAFMVTGCDKATVSEEGTDSDVSAEEVRNEAQKVTDKEVKKAREEAEEAVDRMSDAADEAADAASDAADDVADEASDAIENMKQEMQDN